MLIRFGFEISIECAAPVPMVLTLMPRPELHGRLLAPDSLRITPPLAREDFIDEFGNHKIRVTTRPGRTIFRSDGVARDEGAPDACAPTAVQHEIADLPPTALRYLTASRYVDSDALAAFAWERFGAVPPGWARVQAICDFVHGHTTFDYKFGRPTKTAGEVLNEKTGVCRDFAHLAIALCRAMNIPARYATGYLGDIGVPPAGPGDFCAWFEVFLGGGWYTFDARYNTQRIGRLLMARGLDAADVALITSFGACQMTGFEVWTDEVPPGPECRALQHACTSPAAAPRRRLPEPPTEPPVMADA